MVERFIAARQNDWSAVDRSSLVNAVDFDRGPSQRARPVSEVVSLFREWLCHGELVATGIGEQHADAIEIPSSFWCGSMTFEELRHVRSLDTGERFEWVRLSAEAVTSLFADGAVQPLTMDSVHKYDPSSFNRSYWPLNAAVQWLGQLDANLSNGEIEGALLDAFEAGTITVTGQRADTDARQEIPASEWGNLVFAFDADLEYRADRKGSIQPEWLKLRVPRDAVRALVPLALSNGASHAELERLTERPFGTGMAGRPSMSAPILEQELRRRANTDELEATLGKQVEALLDWLPLAHIGYPVPKQGTCENNLRSLYWELKGARN
ncbi:hypothetical protein [Aureimonas leprariae]|uniref:Uncharacterized protein n=1 Tax=Plantimonas leprariae TaxID=2615207 RepID=A0A7V7PPV9_9HYPH|nr:hypothetical protein [Aureimonas leprariae]KAB0680066.1 hypothetical protein F6X38_09655 [Aureimonas leprariae]